MAEIFGLCPSIGQPLLSGDGYLIRIRPKYGYLNSRQLMSLGKAANQFGNGIIEFTTRANITIRGINDKKLNDLSLFLKNEQIVNQLDTNKTVSNIIYSPFTRLNDKKFLKISKTIEDQLLSIPKIHKKFGIAIDLGSVATLQNIHADLRIEEASNGSLIIRIDGLEYGEEVEQNNLISTLKNITNNIARAAPLDLKYKNFSEIIQYIDYKKFHVPVEKPRKQKFSPKLGPCFHGYLLSSTSGRFTGDQVIQLALQVENIKVTPWKALFIENTARKPKLNFLSKNTDFSLKISHCSGQPYCKQGLTDTTKLANRINKRLKSSYKKNKTDIPNIHISGCEKNCGIPKNISISIRKFKKNNPVEIVNGKHKELADLLTLEFQQ